MFAQQVADAYTQIRVCVAVLVRDERGFILLEKRRDCGLWGLPGGKVEPGESVTETAVREMGEETGFLIKVVRLLGVYSGPADRIITFPDNVVQVIDILLEAKIVSGELTLSHESIELKFFAPHALPSELDMIPPARLPLRDIVAGKVGAIC